MAKRLNGLHVREAFGSNAAQWFLCIFKVSFKRQTDETWQKTNETRGKTLTHTKDIFLYVNPCVLWDFDCTLILTNTLFCMLIQVEMGILQVIPVRLVLTPVRPCRVRALCLATLRTKFAGTVQRSPGSRSHDWRRNFTGRTMCPGREDANWRPP